MSFWERLEHGSVKPWLRQFKPYRTVELGGIRVAYKKHLDGGGREFGQDFIPFLRRRAMPRQRRVFEWCAGPGFIGFSLLGHGLAQTLSLADVNPAAVAANSCPAAIPPPAVCVRSASANGASGSFEPELPILLAQHMENGSNLSSAPLSLP